MPAPLNLFLTFPPLAAEPLAALDRQSQLHASAFLASAARFLSARPTAPLGRCVERPHCLRPAAAPPRRHGTGNGTPPATPLCLLCAVDVAVDRHGYGFPASIQAQFRRVGTVAKQAVIDVLEANPSAPTDYACVHVSTRLHQARLTPQSAAEAAEESDLLHCHRWLPRANYRGAIPDLPEAVAKSLTARGWMVAGLVTPQGKFASEQYKRDQRRARSLRAARTS